MNGKNVELNSIKINEKIPVNLVFERILALYLIAIFVYSVRNFEIFNKTFSEKNLIQEMLLVAILGVFLLVISYINNNSAEKNVYDFYNKNFIEALSKGSISLLEKPNDRLLKMSNPYDSFGRYAEGIIRDKDYIWDSALYNGKYYVYFGILPALILFLPYYLLTGSVLPSAYGVVVFSILSAIAIKALILLLKIF